MSGDDTTTADATEAGTDATGADTDADEPPGEAKIRIENVSKRFGRITALDDVSFEVRDTEIFALIGDNGAGKSTLMNIVCGVHRPTEGEVYLDGEPARFDNPSDARERGIETVYQDLALMNDLDVPTNLFVGQFPTRGVGPLQFIDWDETRARSEEIIRGRLGRDMSLDSEVEFLSGGQRQLVAIGRALAFDPEVIILDEPTSALSVDATELVHSTVRRLSDQGHTVVIVSHDIDSVLEIADRIGVLYRGELVGVTEPGETDLEELTEFMVSGGGGD